MTWLFSGSSKFMVKNHLQKMVLASWTFINSKITELLLLLFGPGTWAIWQFRFVGSIIESERSINTDQWMSLGHHLYEGFRFIFAKKRTARNTIKTYRIKSHGSRWLSRRWSPRTRGNCPVWGRLIHQLDRKPETGWVPSGTPRTHGITPRAPGTSNMDHTTPNTPQHARRAPRRAGPLP